MTYFVSNSTILQGAASRSETSSIHSEISEECFIELDETALTRIHYIVQELINTEKVYMQDLQSIVAVSFGVVLVTS